MSLVVKKFYQMLFFFEKMEKSTFNKVEYEAYLDAFVSSGRNTTWIMQTECKKEGFDEWYKLKQEEMRKDNLLRFFKELRNNIVKEGKSNIGNSEGFSIPHQMNFDGKGNVTITKINKLGGKQTTIKLNANETKNKKGIIVGGINIPFDSGLIEKMYFFDDKDNKLKNSTIFPVNHFCLEYIRKLNIILTEYNERFVK